MIFLEAAKKIIAIESSPESGTLEVVSYLNQFINTTISGLESKLMPSMTLGKKQSNIFINTQSNNFLEKKGLLLLTHLDTTDPGSYGHWNKTSGNPFNLSIYGDEVYGLGVTNKLDFLCKLEALMSFKDVKLQKPIYLAGTHSEEDGLYGVAELIDQKIEKFNQAVIYHPTNLDLCCEGLGIAVVEIEIPFSEEEKKYQNTHNQADNSFTQSKVFRGKSAHSAISGEGISAIVKLFEFLKNMPDVAVMNIDGGILHNTVAEHALIEFVPSGVIRDNIKNKLLNIYAELNKLIENFKRFPHQGYSTNYSTLNIGKIRCSKQGITISGNCRLLPSVPEKEYRSWILNLKNACMKSNSKFSLKRYIPSYDQDKDIELIKNSLEILKQLDLGDDTIKSSTICTEANLMQKNGVECVLFGAGNSIGNSHEPNESISLSSLNQSIDFYKKLIKEVCL